MPPNGVVNPPFEKKLLAAYVTSGVTHSSTNVAIKIFEYILTLILYYRFSVSQSRYTEGMNPRAEWVPVAVTSVVMCAIIVSVAWSRLNDQGTPRAQIIDNAVVVGNPDWSSSLSKVIPASAYTSSSSTGPYRAPTGLTPTEKMAREVVSGYYETRNNNDGAFTAADRAELIKEVVARNTVVIAPTRTYTIANIQTDPNLKTTNYAALVIKTLKSADSVNEFEIDTFSRTVGANNVHGTPKLVGAAATYLSIERSLAEMKVPPALAQDHLELLQGVALLAESTKLMGRWGGDPVLALAYLDAFIRADRAVEVATSKLFYSINKSLANS